MIEMVSVVADVIDIGRDGGILGKDVLAVQICTQCGGEYFCQSF
jgi:hypothetical protein